jgi:hypothetical protein
MQIRALDLFGLKEWRIEFYFPPTMGWEESKKEKLE